MYFIYAEAYDKSGEGMRAVLNQALTLAEANDCVDACRHEQDTTRVVLIEGKTLLDWAPKSESQLDSDDLQNMGVE